MQQWKWSKANEKDLAKFVNGDAVKLLDKLGVNRFDLSHDPDGRKELVRAIYNALVARNINYAYEQYQPAAETQIIRPPHEIQVKAPVSTWQCYFVGCVWAMNCCHCSSSLRDTLLLPFRSSIP